MAERISEKLASFDVDDVRALAAAGKEIRGWMVDQPFPEALEKDIRSAYEQLAADEELSFAVRSSATAEDLPDASSRGSRRRSSTCGASTAC